MSRPCVHRVLHSATCSLDWEECDNCGKGDETSITDELREYAKRWPRTDYIHRDMLAIADRIDAEHNKALMEIRNRAIDQGFDEGFASADDWMAQHEDAMAEHGWIRLPKDADGEVIHAGDEMEWLNGLKRGRVTAIGVGEREGWVWVLMDGKNVSTGNPASDLRHHHAPTVEDVLTELTDEVWNRYCVGGTASDSGISELVAEYAAKLRLREEA